MKKKWKHLLLLSLLLYIPCIAGCGSSEPVTKTGFYFNTVITLTGYGSHAEEIIDEAFSLCDTYERTFSRTLEGSDVWNINHSAGRPVEVSDETVFLLKTALYYSELTGGLIDPTIAPLSELWNFSGDPAGPVPSSEDIEAALVHIDYTCIKIDRNTVLLDDPGAQIDLGFIAKGYIADQMKSFFLEKGMEHALINLGGNVLAVGSKPDGSAYKTGIRKPFSSRNETVSIVALEDRSLVTSGSYERCFTQDDVLYHHILNPTTGYPSDNGLTGVTILSDTSLEGDALSTSCFLLGPDRGFSLIESLSDVEALFIMEDGSIIKTDGFPQ